MTCHRFGRDSVSILGVKIFESPLCTTRVVKRVRGGYLNRWWIRQETNEPAVWVDHARGCLYIHPALAVELEREGRLVEDSWRSSFR